MGKATPQSIETLLEAGFLFPADVEKINQHMIANNIFSKNIRDDSGKSDGWRDYQQVLSALGLMYSGQITSQSNVLTPVGIAYLEKSLSFLEMITLQFLRYQYPNGHNVISNESKEMGYNSLTQLQVMNNVAVRPGALFWIIMYHLHIKGFEPSLTTDELEGFVMKCGTNNDALKCVVDIIKHRGNKTSIVSDANNRRNAQEWIRFAEFTPLFDKVKTGKIKLSAYSLANIDEILQICTVLSDKSTFWFPASSDEKQNRWSWYSFYGTFDVSVSLVPAQGEILDIEEDSERRQSSIAREVNLHHYSFDEAVNLGRSIGRQIISSYDYSKSQKGCRLHDNMVDLIARTCITKGANVFFDPNTVDLFVTHEDSEYLIEVKSITPKNFISRLRYALGQVFQYDYLLESQQPNRRLVLAFAASIPQDSWTVPFVNNHLNLDLLTIENDRLNTYSHLENTKALFGVA
jgi:hypothetical protein